MKRAIIASLIMMCTSCYPYHGVAGANFHYLGNKYLVKCPNGRIDRACINLASSACPKFAVLQVPGKKESKDKAPPGYIIAECLHL